MAFSNEALKTALETVLERKKNAERKHEAQKQTIYSSTPELKDLETQLQIKSSQMAVATLSGDTDKSATLFSEINDIRVCRDQLYEAVNFPKEPEHICKICKDTGYVGNTLCSCVKDIAAKNCYSALISEMPIKESTFSTFDLGYYKDEKNENDVSPKRQMAKVLKICKDFTDSFPNGANLLLSGKSGLGKTHLSLAIANELIKRDYSVIYGTAQNLINEVSREAFDRSGSTEKIDSLTSCDLLILDDLGTEFSTQLSVSVVYNIINTRMLKNLSTVISTNLDIKEVCEFYNDRIASRIVGNYTICTFFGDDIRKIKAANRYKK